ncbi:radical SAM protein [candidate division WWE3 bacterium]|uniref:Radical SAM protein n=1 Tax=candidate division WWE3 bacterium TaxID=2053526 RepID=A0A7X9E6P7_UNCKA|nr:radical SAM protein [candidate division WWE3 bacterium]
MAYKLSPGVYLVTGALRGAILDTNSKKVYSINKSAVSIIQNGQKEDNYWKDLQKLGLAEVTDRYVDSTIPKDRGVAKLDFVWFEICTKKCNLQCIHCYSNSRPPKEDIHSETRETLTHLDWKSLIEEGFSLGCRKCQFIGGEPFEYKDKFGHSVLDLSEYALQVGWKFVELFTNLTLVKPLEIQCIKKLGLSIATTLYSNKEEIHDAVTRTPGSFKRTVENIKLLLDLGVSVRAEIVVTKINQHTIEETIEFRKGLGIKDGKVDLVRPSGRGSDIDTVPDLEYYLKYGLVTKPNFYADLQSICKSRSFNSCLKGKITITEFGDYLPCIFSRSIVLGNSRESRLSDLVNQSNVQSIWKNTKDDVLVCKDCEYRYCCDDCRALSYSSCGEKIGFKSAPFPNCTYNPYTGEWAQGVWNVDEKGDVFYNRKDFN